jgi:4-amino-4-deoxy-L-arabinose transferase-like glycosyltransferase
MNPSGLPKDTRPGDWHRPLLLLALVTVILMTYQLAGTPFRGIYDDVDRSLIARNMVDSGDWLVAHYVWGPLYTKPPLMYWTAGAIGVLTDRSDELPGNLASVLGMFTVVMATFWAGRNLFGTRTGLRAGLLLVTMHLFLAMSRQALLDTVMMGGFALAFGSLIHLGFSGTPRTTRWWLATALGLSLAFLTKGPVILPVFLLIWVPLMFRQPRLRPTLQQLLLSLGVILAVNLPWPLVLLNAAPEAAEVWHSEFFGRFGDGKQFLEWTQKPFWFYVPDLANTMPWLPLLIWAWVGAWKNRKETSWRLLLWWGLAGLVFFSLASSTKRSYYLLPLYPAFALVIAARWQALLAEIRSHGGPGPKTAWIPRLTLGLLAVFSLGFAILPFRFTTLPTLPFLVGGLLATALATFSLTLSWKQQWSRTLPLALTAAALVHLTYFGHFVPLANAYQSGRPFYREARPLIGDSEVVLLEAHLTLSVFYLHEVSWTYARRSNFLEVMGQHPEALVVASPVRAEKFPQLKPLLVKELTEPLGKKREMGLYRWVPPHSEI